MVEFTLKKRPLRLFFSGIGGSGMSALASFMSDSGHEVRGSDRAFDRSPDHDLCRMLRAKGITIVPQDGSGITPELDLAVFSTAVEGDRPEVIRAQQMGIPMLTRPAFLAEIVKRFRTVAVAGTSGKSTTAGMIAFVMHRLGLQPNYIGGGRVTQFMSPSHPGNSLSGDSELLVVEACESDGTIVDYAPDTSLILNLDLDHHAVEETGRMFLSLVRNTARRIVVNADDDNLSRLPLTDTATFSIERQSAFRPDGVMLQPTGSDFSLQGISFHLSLPGKFNLYNALACIATLGLMQIPLGDIAPVLAEFTGIERRFTVHLDDGARLVIEDYAHNPHKISCLLETAAKMRERICYVFQPHGFGPTRMMRYEYVKVFADRLRREDHLVLLPIFYEGGTAAKDIASEDLTDGVVAAGKSAEAIHHRDALLEMTADWDAFVVFGARDESLTGLAKAIAAALMQR
jgi:UDP-N-acetylmuramate--alanine ligase